MYKYTTISCYGYARVWLYTVSVLRKLEMNDIVTKKMSSTDTHIQWKRKAFIIHLAIQVLSNQ